MCTVIIVQGLVPRIPIALACNRDEFFARPTRCFQNWLADGIEVAAGLDEHSGGTWFGVGKKFVAALTNDRRGGTPQPKERTRGELVLQALRAASWTEWEAWQQAQQADAYGDCFLFVSDGTHSRVYANDKGSWSVSALSDGFYVLGNFGVNAEDDPTCQALREAVSHWDWDLEDNVLQQRLRELLSSHGEAGVCVHGDRYGTRSSAIYVQRLKTLTRQNRIWISDQAPCQATWYEASEMLPA